MSDYTIAVTTMAIGEAPSPLSFPPITFAYQHETITVRTLIARTVTAQISAAREQQQQRDTAVQAMLARQYLVEEEVAVQAEQGTVRMPSQTVTGALDLAQEIARAEAAFQAGRFFITVNGYQPETLEEPLLLTNYSQVVFVRLMPLVGG